MKYYLTEHDFKYNNVPVLGLARIKGKLEEMPPNFWEDGQMKKEWVVPVLKPRENEKDLKLDKLHWHHSRDIYTSEELKDALVEKCGSNLGFVQPEAKQIDYPVFIPVPKRFVPLFRELTEIDIDQKIAPRLIPIDWDDELNWYHTPLGRRVKNFTTLDNLTVCGKDIAGTCMALLDDNPTYMFVSEEIKTVIEGFDFCEVRFEEIRVVNDC